MLPGTSLESIVLAVCKNNQDNADHILTQLNDQEVLSLGDLTNFTAKDLDDTVDGVKPPKRRADLRVALLPFIKPAQTGMFSGLLSSLVTKSTVSA
jgi:hypothetical protein